MLSRLIRSSSLLPTPHAIRPPTHNLDKINNDVELVPDDTRHRRVDAVYGAAQRLEVDVRADLRTKRSQNAAREPFFLFARSRPVGRFEVGLFRTRVQLGHSLMEQGVHWTTGRMI